MASKITVEITDPADFHCFRLAFESRDQQQIEIMLHARALVDLIHEASVALCAWQHSTSERLILQLTGLSEREARDRGLIA